VSRRLDQELVARELATSRSAAQRAIADGLVLVDGHPITRPGVRVEPDQRIDAPRAQWVSRAAEKLLGALEDLPVPVPARVLDAGASTGGFTQVLLDRGAERVYAVDVGHGQLHPLIRNDPRVVVHEGLNLRELHLGHLDDHPVDLVVADVSFISLRQLVEPILSVLSPHGQALLMIKPQFEVGRELLGAGGVVRDPRHHRAAVDGVVQICADLGWREVGRAQSRLVGRHGNVEWFVWLATGPTGAAPAASPGPA
jgi:23S rRNA (cytidine1920-2'-O)/16S rRNA (cytidine1409-2'-O)-methyltransferase